MLFGKHSLLRIRIIRITSIHSMGKIQNFISILVVHAALRIKKKLKFPHKLKHIKSNPPPF